MGLMPYVEYFPCAMKLEQMENDDLEMFKIYGELICHFYICMDVHNTRGNASGIKVWADYLLPILDGASEDIQFPIPEENIHQKMVSNAHGDVVLEDDDGIYEKGDRFKRFHHQAKHHMSQKALPSGFLLVWLKSCVIPPHDGIYHGCFSLRSSSFMGNLLAYFLPWSVVFSVVSGR